MNTPIFIVTLNLFQGPFLRATGTLDRTSGPRGLWLSAGHRAFGTMDPETSSG